MPPAPSTSLQSPSWSFFLRFGNQLGIGRAYARDLNDHRLSPRLSEVRPTRRLGVIASRGQGLQRRGVELVAVSEVPRPGHHCGDTVVAMFVRRDARVRGDVKHDGVE